VTAKAVNQSVPEALERLGYSPQQISDIIAYIVGTGALRGTLYINRVREAGLRKEQGAAG
jgi:ribonucleoside-diphosphate reductase alpha chain